MINCPSCGKEIADDSAHCGYCGSELEMGSGKKTIVGFAAITPQMMQEAAEAAKAGRPVDLDPTPAPTPAAESEPDEPTGGQHKLSFGIPKPGGASAASSGPGVPKLSIPKPGGPPSQDDAPTQMSPAVEVESAPEAPAVSSPVPAEPAGPESVDIASTPTEPPEFSGGHVAGTTDPPWAASGPSEDTMPEMEPVRTATAEVDASAGGSQMVGAPPTSLEKKKNPLIYVGIGFAVLIALCCIINLVFYALSML